MNTMTLQKTAKHLILIVSLIGVTSCATEHYRFDKTHTASALGRSIDKRAALVLQPEFCSYSYQPEYTAVFEVGEALCASLEASVRNIFSDVIIISTGNVGTLADVDLIATPKVADMSFFYRRAIPVTVDTDILVEWTVTDNTGAILAVKTVQGTGEDERMWGGYTTRYRASVQRAIDELVEKSVKFLVLLNK